MSNIVHVGALVAYDGTDYRGFQLQKDAPTVQGALEDALLELTGTHCRLAGSGRTDTGVHASGQVVSTNVPWKHEMLSLERAWNVHLPFNVQVRCVSALPEDFHPRFSAGTRTYRYTVHWHPNASRGALRKTWPLSHRFASYVPNPLDLDAMNVAAQMLIGTLDFATFGQPPQGDNTVRTITRAEWYAVETTLEPLRDLGQKLVFTISATAFLRQMVRNLVGALLRVGVGTWSPDDLQSALDAKSRARAAPTAPPNGLVLESVSYPDYPNLFREL